jgi:hypothetical protein
MVIFFLLIQLHYYSCTSSVNPLFQCWFETYKDNSRIYNLVMGYNNTNQDGLDIIIAIGQDVNDNQNTIIPFNYNGIQPYIFKPSLNSFIFVIQDSLNTLNDQQTIQWKLSNQIVNISLSDVESLENQCKVKYNDICPLWISNFCEDSIYCNGMESCFTNYAYNGGDINNANTTNVLPSNFGTCVKSSQIIDCNTSTEQCDENELSCKLITSSPTTQIPPPPPSTEEIVETVLPTEPKECIVDDDCKNFTQFCQGEFKCDQIISKCIPKDLGFNACQNEQTKLDQFYSLIGDGGIGGENGGGLVITCVEHAKLCVESFYCVHDSQCDDGNICNGKETCSPSGGASCQSANDKSIETICGNSNMICLQDKGCVTKQTAPTTDANSNVGIFIVIAVAVFVVLGVIAVVALAIYINMRKSSDKSKKKSKKSKKNQ